MFLQRPGGQAQFSARATVAAPRSATLRRALDLVAANPSGDHRLATMAAELAISERHLTREQRGVTDGRVDAVWDAIALHTSPTYHLSPVYQRRRAPEIGIAMDGIGIDVLGGPDALPPGYATACSPCTPVSVVPAR